MASPTPTPRHLVSIPDAAEYLGVNQRTIRRMIARGDLPAIRVKGTQIIRVDLNDVDQLLIAPIPTGGDQ